MDWTMINNAGDPKGRIQTLFYLCRFRYEWDAASAGRQLAATPSDNLLCKRTVAELRAELGSPSADLGIVRVADADVRSYLATMLSTYDQVPAGE
jgi:hypothetical protein